MNGKFRNTILFSLYVYMIKVYLKTSRNFYYLHYCVNLSYHLIETTFWVVTG